MILSVYLKGLLKEIEIQPSLILEFYEQLTKHEIRSTQVFIEEKGFFKLLDATGIISSPVTYPDTGIRCDVEASRNGRNNLHIPLPIPTRQSIKKSISAFLQALDIKEYHITFEYLGIK